MRPIWPNRTSGDVPRTSIDRVTLQLVGGSSRYDMKWFVLAISVGLGVSGTANDARSLSFYHTHTGKALSVVYYENGAYSATALDTVDAFLRDFRTGDEHRMDPVLLDVLYDIKLKTHTRAPFQVISAYRSPVTNQMLRDNSAGVAKDSMHLRGQAIDVRLADVPLDELRAVALDLQRGGVGFYPESQFVHVDTGRVRRW
jgi:uncharacterized protein YcbK (DUF882 family)